MAAATTSPAPPSPSGWCSGAPTRVPTTAVGGYDYRDNHLKGFSLTHLERRRLRSLRRLSLPADDRTARILARAVAGSSLAGAVPARASPTPASRPGPGYYSMRLNPANGEGGIETELTATTRTGLARFTFPASPHSSILINAGGSAQPDDYAARADQSRRRRNHWHRLQRPVLRPAAPLQGLLRGASSAVPSPPMAPGSATQLSPGSTAASRHPDLRRAIRRATAAAGAYATFDTTQTTVVAGPGRRLLRQRRRRPRQPRGGRPRPALRRRSRPRARAQLEHGARARSRSAAAPPA